MIYKQQYTVHFDFTTVHSKGRFVGRSGSMQVETKYSLEEMNKDIDTLQRTCAEFIYTKKPKWNILMLTVTNITPIQIKQHIV